MSFSLKKESEKEGKDVIFEREITKSVRRNFSVK